MPSSPRAAGGRLASRPISTDGALPPGEHRLVEVGLAGTVVAVPPELRTPAPLLVFFHGAGGTADNVLPLVRDAAAAHGALVLAPSSAGSTWDLLTGSLGRDVAALDAALQHVFTRCAVDRVALGGFSDGGSYALSIGVANGDLAQAVLAFSPGFLAPPEQVGQPRVWVSHGTGDRVLPVDRCGRRVVELLSRAGYEVAYEEFDGGHVVPPDLVRAAFGWWLSEPA